MQLRIETFDNAKGGNAFYKAVTHPLAARRAKELVERLEASFRASPASLSTRPAKSCSRCVRNPDIMSRIEAPNGAMANG
jgi:hypothetical protein